MITVLSCDDNDGSLLRCLCIAALLPMIHLDDIHEGLVLRICQILYDSRIMMRHSRVSHIRLIVELTSNRAPSGLACRSDGRTGCGRLDRTSDRICMSC